MIPLGVAITEGEPRYQTLLRCAKCAAQQNKQFEVSREELKEMIYTMPFTKIGEYFGVSDNSIRKRCKVLGLPSTKAEIKKFTPEQWETI